MIAWIKSDLIINAVKNYKLISEEIEDTGFDFKDYVDIYRDEGGNTLEGAILLAIEDGIDEDYYDKEDKLVWLKEMKIKPINWKHASLRFIYSDIHNSEIKTGAAMNWIKAKSESYLEEIEDGTDLDVAYDALTKELHVGDFVRFFAHGSEHIKGTITGIVKQTKMETGDPMRMVAIHTSSGTDYGKRDKYLIKIDSLD